MMIVHYIRITLHGFTLWLENSTNNRDFVGS